MDILRRIKLNIILFRYDISNLIGRIPGSGIAGNTFFFLKRKVSRKKEEDDIRVMVRHNISSSYRNLKYALSKLDRRQDRASQSIAEKVSDLCWGIKQIKADSKLREFKPRKSYLRKSKGKEMPFRIPELEKPLKIGKKAPLPGSTRKPGAKRKKKLTFKLVYVHKAGR